MELAITGEFIIFQTVGKLRKELAETVSKGYTISVYNEIFGD